MSLDQPKISYVIASKNDNYCGDNLLRLSRTVNQVLSLQPESEVIVVDWGSTDFISNDMHLDCCDYKKRLRFVNVPGSITKQSSSPFNEVLALNIGIRRARGTYIARLDQDILIGERYAKWTRELPDSGLCPAYFSIRRELPKDWTDVLNEKKLTGMVGLSCETWGNWPIENPFFYRSAVGILLAPRHAWHTLRGYDERMIHRNHMEHDLCLRFKKLIGLENLGLITDADFYHQYHDTTDFDNRKHNEEKKLEKDDLENLPLFYNDFNWGLGSEKFEEVVI